MDTTSTLPRPTGPAPAAPENQPPTQSPVPPHAGAPTGTSRLNRLWRGSAEDPSWARPAFLGLLLATGLLYLWGLGESGWANSFYSAAAQAGSESWKAFFFGSSDAANSITVDKTPLSLWPMALSVRVFGLSSWSILVPQALMGVATVGLLHQVVRRTTGSAVAGMIAGTAMALTPVAVLMFRFNNPDAMLTLLMLGAAAATLRGIESTRLPEGVRAHPVRWLALGGTLVGLAFLTKMMQAFLVLPALALAYLLFAQTSWGKRLGHLLVAFGSMLLAGGWWIADRRALARFEPPVDRRLAEQLHPRAHPRLQRPRPAQRQRDRLRRRRRWPGRRRLGQRPASCACSTARSAARSPGCSRPRWCSVLPPCGSRGVGRTCSPRSRSSARGCSSPG